MNTPCHGANPFDVDAMLPRCARCPITRQCRQLAADAPFSVEGVWGGLVLPAQRSELPPPRTTPAYPDPDPERGRPPWYEETARNYEPDTKGRHTQSVPSRPFPVHNTARHLRHDLFPV